MAGKPKLFATKEELEELYNQYQSAYKIAEIYGVNCKTVYSLMKRYEIKQTTGSQGARKNNFNHDFFESVDAPIKAYWLGFIMADGCVYRGSDKSSYRLQINLKADDIGHLELFQKAIGSSYKIQVKDIKTSKVCILKINSTKLCLDLIKHGVTERKSLICSYPAIESCLTPHFVRGYFDGDGCLTKSVRGWRWSIVGGEEMLTSIKEKIPALLNIYGKEEDAFKQLVCATKKELLRILQWQYNGSNESIRLSRKYDKYLSLLGELREAT